MMLKLNIILYFKLPNLYIKHCDSNSLQVIMVLTHIRHFSVTADLRICKV